MSFSSLGTRIQSMGFAAIVMSVSILLSRFMGLLRDKVISWQFGATDEADLYFAAFTVPDFINYLLAGGYVSITLMPLLSKRFLEDESDAWRFFSAVFWWALFAVSALTFVAWIWAHPLAQLVAPGFSAEQSQRLAYFLRLILPAQVFFVSGACFSALLFLRKQFFVPALTPLIYNGFIIICGLAVPYFGLGQGMTGFCIGVSLGALIGAWALPYWAAMQENSTQLGANTNENITSEGGSGVHLCPPNFTNLRHPLMRSFLFMALPLMLGQSVVMLNEQFMRIFGSLVGDGAVSLLSYARRISQVPVGMVAQALAVASYPFLASLASKKDFTTFNSTLQSAMSTSFCLLFPISAWMIATAIPCMGFIFEGGNFSHQDTLLSAPLLQIMMLSVPLWGVQMVLGRAFYALGDTFTPAMTGTAITIISLPIFYYALPYGALGVALVSFAGVIVYVAAIMYIWRKRRGSSAFIGLGKNILQLTFFSSLSAIVAWFISNFFINMNLPSIWSYVIALATSGIAFALCYILLAYFFCREILTPILKKLRIKKLQ